jgi:hypothetical protein
MSTSYQLAQAQWGGYGAGSKTAVSPAPSSYKVTRDDPHTGWNSSRQLLASPKVREVLKERIRMQDYGGSFISESGSLTTNYSFDGWTDPYPTRNTLLYGDLSLNGTFHCSTGWSPTLPTEEVQLLGLIGFGGNAIRATSPTKEQAGLSVFLGELREGLPSMLGAHLLKSRSFLSSMRGSGSEYLNLQFGVMPLVRDLQALVRSVERSEAILAQLKRDAGRPVRRRLHLPPDVSSGVVRENYIPSPSLVTWLYTYLDTSKSGYGFWESSEERWFSGEFRYYWPQAGNTLLDKMGTYKREARVLYGLTLDPSTFWELTRFSWLFDWFIDIGGFLDGIALMGSDRLVIPHAYAMSHVQYTQSIASRTTLCGQVPFRQTRTVERKMRVRASPYGFDVGWDSLSAFQTSILAALGLSRTPLALFRNPRRIH